MKILIVSNFSTPRCGFRNFSDQAVRAFRNEGHTVDAFDGTYPLVYQRIQEGLGNGAYLPDTVQSYDVVHLIWHPATMNHYSGASFPPGPLYSFWNGHPYAGNPLPPVFGVQFSPIAIDGHIEAFYPIVDWITDLPQPAEEFTVGLTGVRREGFEEVTAICQREGWQVNAGDPETWIPLEDEIRRLARSSVNVSWYSPKHPDRSGGVMTALASGRPQIVSRVPMFDHFQITDEHERTTYPDDLYHGEYSAEKLEYLLTLAYENWKAGCLRDPKATRDRFSWTRSVQQLTEIWHDRIVSEVWR